MNRLDIILRHESIPPTRLQSSPSKFLASPDSRVKLSKSIDKSMLSPEDYKTSLNLQNQYIEELDAIPTKFRRANTLILNNNHLKNLRGIEQFSKLKKLYVADNDLDDILNVYYLAALPKLEEVDFRGNELVNIPNYKDTVLLFVPGLKVLDGKTIKANEKEKVNPDVKKQYVLLEKLLANYIELIKLQSIAKKLEVHKELFNKDRRFLMNFVRFEVNKFKKMYSYFQDIDEKVRNDYRTDLLRDVRTIEVNFLQRDDMETAVQELASRQLAKIAELTKQIEKKASVLESVYNANIEKLKRFKIKEDAIVIVSEPQKEITKSPKKKQSIQFSSPTEGRPSQRFGKDVKSTRAADAQKLRGSDQILPPPTNSARDFGLRKSNISQRGERISTNQKDSKGRFNSKGKERISSPDQEDFGSASGHRKFMSVNFIQSSPPRQEDYTVKQAQYGSHINIEEDVPRQLSISQVQPAVYQEENNLKEDNEENEVEPEEIIPKEVVIEKDKEITNLAKELQEKIAEVIKIAGINKQIKDKLKDFEEQNHLNTKVVQEEVDRILRFAQAVQDSKKDLEKEAKELKQSLQELAKLNDELEAEKQNLEAENTQLLAFKEEVKVREVLEEKEYLAINYYGRKLVQKGFKFLKSAVQRSKIVEEMSQTNRALKAFRMQETIFGVFKKLMIVRRIGNYKKQEKGLVLLQNIITSWKEICRRKKVMKYWESKRNVDAMYAAFVCWSHYRDIRQNRRSIKMKIQGYYENKLLKTSMEGFKKVFKMFRHEEEVENELDGIALDHQKQRLVRFCFENWREVVRGILLPKRLKNTIAQTFYKRNLSVLGFQLIKTNLQLYKQITQSAEIMAVYRNNNLLKATFVAWSKDFRVVSKIRDEEKRLQDLFFLRKRFSYWRRAFFESQRAAEFAETADSHYQNKLIVKSYRGFLSNLISKKRGRMVYSQLKGKKTSNLVVSCFDMWRKAFIQNLKERKKERLYILEAERLYFDRWREFFRLNKEEKQINARALRLREKCLAKHLAIIFNAWQKWSQWKKRCQAVLEYRKQRQVKAVYRKVLEDLRMRRLRTLKEKFESLNNEYQAEESRVEKNAEEIKRVSQERTELIDKFEQLSRNMDELKEDIKKQEKYTDKCRDEIRGREDAILRLEREILDREREIDKIEKDNKKSNENIQKKIKDFENTKANHAEEKSGLNNQILKLEKDLDQRTKAVEEAEKEKKRQANDLEEFVRKNEEMIEALCRELKEAKGSLTLKDQEVREATELIGEYELRNKTIKDQVEDTLNDIEKTSINYAEKIKELEMHNEILIDQMRTLDKKSEKQTTEIRDLKETIRKFEQEAGSIAEQQHKETEEFIRNIQRSRIIDEQSVRFSARVVSSQIEESGKIRLERANDESRRESLRNYDKSPSSSNRNSELKSTIGIARRQIEEANEGLEGNVTTKYYRRGGSNRLLYEETKTIEGSKGEDTSKSSKSLTNVGPKRSSEGMQEFNEKDGTQQK